MPSTDVEGMIELAATGRVASARDLLCGCEELGRRQIEANDGHEVKGLSVGESELGEHVYDFN